MTNSFFDSENNSALVDPKSLETLELRISQILEKLKVLQNEKLELQKQVANLQTRYNEAAAKAEELSRECESLKHNQRDVKQEELIRSKITALLTKLEGA